MKNISFILILIMLTGCSSQKKLSQAEKKAPAKKEVADAFDFGTTEKGSYTNDYFNLTLDFDPNWVVQDQDQVNHLIDLGTEAVAGDDDVMKAMLDASMVNTAYLLTMFKHEQGAPVDFNPSFMVLAENLKNAPGIENGSDYLFHVKKLLKQTNLDYTFEKEVYERKVGNSQLAVLEAKLKQMGLEVTQEFVTIIRKGFAMGFIISYHNDEQKKELYKILDTVKL